MLPITSQPSARIPDEFLDGPNETTRGFRRRGNAVAGVAIDSVAAVTNSSRERPETCGCCYDFHEKHFTAAGIERKGPEKTKTDGVIAGIGFTSCCCVLPFESYLCYEVGKQVASGSSKVGCTAFLEETVCKCCPTTGCCKSFGVSAGVWGPVLGVLGLGIATGACVAGACYRHVAHAIDVKSEEATKEETEAAKSDVVKDGLKGAFNNSTQRKVKEADDDPNKTKEGNTARGRLCFTKGDGADLTIELLALEPDEDTSKKLGMVEDKAPQLKRETDDDYN